MSGAERAVPGLVGKVISIHEALKRASIGHGFGGGIALAFAVEEPRATDDIDLNIAVPVALAEEVLAVLPPGIEAKAAAVDTIRREGQDRLRWGDTPVDLFFPQHDFHRTVAERTSELPFAATTIPVISATDLVVFKAMFDRPRDWLDIEAVLRAGSADVDDAVRWIGRILGADHPARTRLLDLIDRVARAAPAAEDTDPNPWRQLRRDTD